MCIGRIAVAVALAVPVLAFSADWVVAVDGRRDGIGSRESPWDLASALDGSKPVQPGDQVLLLPGTYRRRPDEYFVVKLRGELAHPITVRPAAGARVIIDGGLRVVSPARSVWIRDLEILVSEPDTTRTNPAEAGSFPKYDRPWGGIDAQSGEDVKFIDLSIHDCRQGMGLWKDCLRAEVSGCVIYDNGWTGVDRGHGHAIYTQNAQGVKVIRNCIFTGGRGYSLHAYGSPRAFVNNYLVENNVFYASGPALVGGESPSEGIVIRDNLFDHVQLRVGYASKTSIDCTVSGNVIAGQPPSITGFSKVREEANRVVRGEAERPAEPEVRLLRDPYDARRAHLIVFNWPNRSSVHVDTAGFAKHGQPVLLFDPRNLQVPVRTYRCEKDGFDLATPGGFAVYVLRTP